MHAEAGTNDHRERKELQLEERWGPRHPISLKGKLREWIGQEEIMVNSLHGQGISTLGKGPVAEAVPKTASSRPLRTRRASLLPRRAVAPEWNAKTNPVSVTLFRRFGRAAGMRHT